MIFLSAIRCLAFFGFILAGLLLFAACASPKPVPVDRPISLQQLRDMFDSIERGAGWDMSQPMLWGYFFTDSDRDKLRRAADELVEQGYRFVDIFEASDDDPVSLYFLHMEKVEIHDPESLDRRNQELYDLAERLGLRSYDGMDVGPPEHDLSE